MAEAQDLQQLDTASQERSQAQPNTPEMDPRVEAYIYKKNDDIASAFEDPQEFIRQLNAFQAQAQAIEDLEADQINNPNPQEITGDPLDESTPSLKNQELQTNLWVNKILNLLGTVNSQAVINNLNINAPTLRLLDQLGTKLSPYDLQMGKQGLPLVFKVLSNAFNKRINNPLTDVLADADFRELAVLNPRIHRQLTDAISDAARTGAGGKSNKEVNDFRRLRASENLEMTGRSQSNSYTEIELLSIFKDKKNKENRNAELFYRAIKDGNVEDFMNYYQEQVDTILTDVSGGQNKTNQENGMTREQAEKRVTEEMHKSILYMVNSIFSTTLDRPPNEDFDKVARSLGSYAADPIRVFEETIAGNLSRLADNAQKFVEQNGDNLRRLPTFYGFNRETREYYSEKTNKIESTTVPMAELQSLKFDRFINSLREIAEVERGALRYQFNFGYLMRNPPGPDKGGLFGSIASYSSSLNTETIDSLNILPYNEIIRAAVIGLEGEYKRLFARVDWRKTPDLESEVFDSLPRAERNTLNNLLDYFSKQGVPPWAIKRSFYLARLEAFGKEFMMQSLASYADPNLTDEGGETYLGEGMLAKNSVFDIWDATKRWGAGADVYLMGLPFLPGTKDLTKFHPDELLKEGKKRWKDSFTNGKMAYFDHPDFKDSPPLIAMHNFSKMGGVDSYGGWRLKYAYMPWMSQLIDRKTQDFNFNLNDPQAFVKGWKSIENIGTNVLKNYMDSFLLNDDSLSLHEGQLGQEAKYEQLFKFMYRRYFQKGVGKAMYADIQNEEEYWDFMKKRLMGAGSKEEDNKPFAKSQIIETVHNAMTVQLYERIPLEFFSMEKRRSSQNGVTLRQELLEEFVGSENQRGRWTEDGVSKDDVISYRWETALNDITFVEQITRMESIQQMRKRQQESTDKNKLGILYGDLNNDESEIQYRVDEESIDRILRDRYQNDRDMEAKVSRAKELYTRMTEKVMQKPKEGEREIQWKAAGDMATYDSARNFMKNRVSWFAEAWRTGDLGMQFTADIAGQFLDRSATGEGVISRTAEACQFLSESAKNWLQGDAYSGLTDAIRKGRAGWSTGIDSIKKFYETTKNEDKDRGKAMVKEFVNWMIMGLRRDTRYEQGLAKLSRGLERKRISLAGVKVGDGSPEYSFGKQDVYEWVTQFVQGNILPTYTPGDEIKYKEIPPTILQKLKAGLMGKEADVQLVRDYASELSGEALRNLHNADTKDLINQNALPLSITIVLAVLYALLEEAIDDD